MAIMSMLAASADLSFTELRDALGMTDGNLITHIRTLQEAGYVSVTKSFQNHRPLTTCSLTRPAGAPSPATSTCWKQIVRQSKSKRTMKTGRGGLARFNTLYYKVTGEHENHSSRTSRHVLRRPRRHRAGFEASRNGQPLTILGDLVHNERVLAELRARGIRIAQHAAAVETAAAMVTAHGASEKAMNRARERGLVLTEATCPLVRVAHRAVARLVREGYHPVIVGQRDHVEVRGLTEDLADFDVVLSEADLFELRERARFGVAAQTTQPIERVRRLVELLRLRFPSAEVRFIDTVCQPTKQRQNAALGTRPAIRRGGGDWRRAEQ